MVHQVGLGNVAAHAVAEDEHRRAWVLLADVLAEQAQVIDHRVPAFMGGEQAKGAELGGAAVAALVVGDQGKTCGAQGFAQALIAPGMLGHAVGQQHHRLDRRARQPLIDVQAAVVAGR
ncbi:hypothetical protein D3C77_670380 [compost metagenome]